MTNYNELSRRLIYAIYGADIIYYLKLNNNRKNYAELSIMYMLEKIKTCSQKDISNILHIAPTTINTIIKRWEKEGYIYQTQIAGKKREMQINLNDTGEEYIKNTLKDFYKKEENAIKKTLEKYSDEFINAIEYFRDCLKEAFDE